jgi:hypothetical protein
MMSQTGTRRQDRHDFLQAMYKKTTQVGNLADVRGI